VVKWILYVQLIAGQRANRRSEMAIALENDTSCKKPQTENVFGVCRVDVVSWCWGLLMTCLIVLVGVSVSRQRWAVWNLPSTWTEEIG